MYTIIYANYGVLAHEKTTVYTSTPHDHATTSEAFFVKLPKSLNPYVTETNSIAIAPENAYTYMLSEVLGERKNSPVITYYDKDTTPHTIPLKRLEVEDIFEDVYLIESFTKEGDFVARRYAKGFKLANTIAEQIDADMCRKLQKGEFEFVNPNWIEEA